MHFWNRWACVGYSPAPGSHSKKGHVPYSRVPLSVLMACSLLCNWMLVGTSQHWWVPYCFYNIMGISSTKNKSLTLSCHFSYAYKVLKNKEYIYIYIYIHEVFTHTIIRNYNPHKHTHAYTHSRAHVKNSTQSQRFFTVFFDFRFIHFFSLSAWRLLFVKTSWNQRSQKNFHDIKYINLIYIYLFIII